MKVNLSPPNGACEQHPKLRDADLLENCAKTIRELQDQGASACDRLALTYAFLNATGPRPLSPDNEYLPNFGSKVSPSFLERRAQELRTEVSHEISARQFEFPAPKVDALHTFVAKFQAMSFEVENAANQWLRADEQTRPDFLKVFFSKLRALTIEAAQYGLDKPQPPTV